MQAAPLGCRQRVEAFAQGVPGQRMHAQPVPLFVGHEDGRVAGQRCQALRGGHGLDQGAAKLGMQVVQHRHAGQERQGVGIEVGQQMADESFAQFTALGLQRHHAAALAAALQHRKRQLQAQRPALGHFVQARGRVAVSRRAEAVAHQLDGLFDAEAQLRRPRHGTLSVGDQVVDPELAVAARGHDRQQVGRKVAQQVAQRLARGPGQAVRLVHDQHHVQRRLRHLGQPGGDALQSARRDGIQQHMAEGRPAGADAHGQRQALDEARRVVLRLGRQPGDHGAARQVLTAPLRQQRSLAESGGGLHQHHRVIAPAGVVRLHARARQQMPGHPRRRDLEQQVAGGSNRGRRHRLPGFIGGGLGHAGGVGARGRWPLTAKSWLNSTLAPWSANAVFMPPHRE